MTAESSDRQSPSSLALWSWALYDFGNSAFTTLVVTFVYSTWFTQAMAPDEATGTGRWGIGVVVSAILIALLAPVIGTVADRNATRRRWMTGLTFTAVLATVALTFVAPPHWMLALTVFVIANVAYELGLAVYNAFLPKLSSDENAGRISAYAWALGYAGGLLCLALGLVIVMGDSLSADDGWKYRATNLLVAGWYLVFCIPCMLFVPEPAADPAAAFSIKGFGHLLRFRQAIRLLIARLIYNDGLVAIFAFGGIYAAGTFGFSFEKILVFGITLNVAAGLGAFAFGFVDDRIGGKKTILISLVGLCVAAGLAASTSSESLFWASGVLIGLLIGPNQSASRSLMSRFVPRQSAGEFFGLYAFSGKATSFAAPFLLSSLTYATGSQRVGVASVILFFIAGGLILLCVDEPEGRRFAVAEQARLDAAS